MGPLMSLSSFCGMEKDALLTAGIAVAVDGRNPEVGRSGVKDNLEGLGRGSNGDDPIVGDLCGKVQLTILTWV